MVVAQQTESAVRSVALQLLLQCGLRIIVGIVIIIVVEGVVGGDQAGGATLLIPESGIKKVPKV